MTHSSANGGALDHDENLNKILDAAPEHEREALANAWRAAEAGMTNHALDESREAAVWKQLAAVAHAADVPSSEHVAQTSLRSPRLAPHRRTRRVSRQIGALAAALAVPAVAVYLTALLSQPDPVSFTADLGDTQVVSLPDGSSVEMNAGSSIEYKETRTARIARLEGEAFFDVQTVDESVGKPFHVETFNASVTVLGTRFNVQAWSNDHEPATTVALEEGVVALRAADEAFSDGAITMQPGEKRRVLTTGAISKAEPIDGTMAWRTGGVFYRDATLISVLADVERRFAISIDLIATDARNRRVNLALRSPADAEEVIETLCAGYGLAYRPTANGFSITTFEP